MQIYSTSWTSKRARLTRAAELWFQRSEQQEQCANQFRKLAVGVDWTKEQRSGTTPSDYATQKTI
jgi:Holliday junction resolvase-like predicted endonuclease